MKKCSLLQKKNSEWASNLCSAKNDDDDFHSHFRPAAEGQVTRVKKKKKGSIKVRFLLLAVPALGSTGEMT